MLIEVWATDCSTAQLATTTIPRGL